MLSRGPQLVMPVNFVMEKFGRGLGFALDLWFGASRVGVSASSLDGGFADEGWTRGQPVKVVSSARRASRGVKSSSVVSVVGSTGSG